MENQANDSSKNIHRIEQPNDMDVLCGRGRAIRSHPGNQVYISLIQRQKSEYVKAEKGWKLEVVRKVVQEIRNKNGRFLQKKSMKNKNNQNQNNDHDKNKNNNNIGNETNDGYWIDIGDHKAIIKTAQAFRDLRDDVVVVDVAAGGNENNNNLNENLNHQITSKQKMNKNKNKMTIKIKNIHHMKKDRSMRKLNTDHHTTQLSADNPQCVLSSSSSSSSPVTLSSFKYINNKQSLRKVNKTTKLGFIMNRFARGSMPKKRSSSSPSSPSSSTSSDHDDDEKPIDVCKTNPVQSFHTRKEINVESDDDDDDDNNNKNNNVVDDDVSDTETEDSFPMYHRHQEQRRPQQRQQQHQVS